MRQRTAVIEDKLTLGDSGTKTVDIDLHDPITELEVRLDVDNGATYNKASPLARCVDKIELVDGSDVLYSMSGTMARGAFAGIEGFVPQHYMTEVGSDTPYSSFPLRFGRWLWDQQYSFNPNAFRNPQLKVSWNLANVNAVGATGFSTGTLQLSVNAKLMEDGQNPTAFMMSKEIESFTSLGSGERRVDMPIDYPYRAIFVRAFEAGTDIRSSITHFKLSLDGERMIPVDLAVEDVLYDWLNANAPLHSLVLNVMSNGTASETWIGLSLGGTLAARSSDLIVGSDYFWKGRVLPYLVNGAGATQSNKGVFVHDVGVAYFNVIPYIFGSKHEPTDWMQAQAHQSIKLYLTQGNADATVTVGLQQVRGY